MKPLITTLVVVGLAVASGHAVAQQTAPIAPAPAAAPAAPPAEAHVAIAREVVVASGLSRSFDGIPSQIADQIRVGISRTRPELIKDLEEVLRPIVADMSRQSGQMINAAAILFARRMTQAELTEIAAFFKSASGQKYVNSQPQLLNDLFTEMQVFSQTMGNVMSDRVRDDMRKKGHQL